MLKNVIESYRIKDLPENLIDFLPKLRKRGNDARILKTWTDHFRQVGAPYVVTEDDCFRTLWKEKIATTERY